MAEYDVSVVVISNNNPRNNKKVRPFNKNDLTQYDIFPYIVSINDCFIEYLVVFLIKKTWLAPSRRRRRQP